MTDQHLQESTQALPGLPPGEDAIITLRNVAKWYGDVVAVSDVSFGIGRGVTGLLGPNGAGKSTIPNMLAGLLAPSAGTIRVMDQAVRGNAGIYRQIGMASEHEQLYGTLRGREFVHMNAILQKTPNPDQATERAISVV